MRTLLSLGAPLLLSSALCADVIHRSDGDALEDVTIAQETLREVTYKVSGKSGTKSIPSEKVIRIEYKRLPRLVDEAETLIADGADADGLDQLRLYVDGFLSGGKKERMAWAPAYAANRILQVYTTNRDFQSAVSAAQRVIEKFPDSRYVPSAYLAKADALLVLGKKDDARKSLEGLLALVEKEALPERWRLEGELALVTNDDGLKGSKRREKLVEISGRAGSQYPTVRNRADVAEGETLVVEKKFDDAEKIFRRIVKDSKADDRTLAAAYTGLGDCLFQEAADALNDSDTDAKPLLDDALLNYMRVPVLYEGEAAYMAKSMFFAGRVYDLMGGEQDRERAQRMYREVRRKFRGSGWAEEASNFIK